MLSQVVRNDIYQNQNFNLYNKVEVDSTSTEVTLWDAHIPSIGIPVGSSIELKAFGSLGSSTELKTIKVKINDEVVLTSSSDSITSLWLTKNKSVVTDEGSDRVIQSYPQALPIPEPNHLSNY